AFRVGGGQATLAARFVDTAKRRADSTAAAVVTPGFGTAGRPGLRPASIDDANAANTGVLAFADGLWALWEAGSPTMVDARDLSTAGVKTLRPNLAHPPFLAHPRAETGGEIWNLGVTGDKALVWRLSSTGAVISADA